MLPLGTASKHRQVENHSKQPRYQFQNVTKGQDNVLRSSNLFYLNNNNQSTQNNGSSENRLKIGGPSRTRTGDLWLVKPTS